MQTHKALLTFRNWRQIRYSSTSKAFRPQAPVRSRLGNFVRTRSERLLLWLQGRQRQHYGPKAPIQELFQRKDLPFFALQSGQMRIQATPPANSHDILNAAASVGALEERIGYTFKDKMLCIQALKISGTHMSLHFDGTTYATDRNNRLALLGDRVLSLAVCEMWFQTENSACM
jgi:hypothetical protein